MVIKSISFNIRRKSNENSCFSLLTVGFVSHIFAIWYLINKNTNCKEKKVTTFCILIEIYRKLYFILNDNLPNGLKFNVCVIVYKTKCCFLLINSFIKHFIFKWNSKILCRLDWFLLHWNWLIIYDLPNGSFLCRFYNDAT